MIFTRLTPQAAMGASARRLLLTVAILSAAFVGCTLGPDYRRPALEAPPAFRHQQSFAELSSIADLPWWQIFQDQSLAALVNTALINNHDLRIAVTRIEQARAIGAQIHSQMFPRFGYDFNVSRDRDSSAGRSSSSGAISNAFSGLLNASWEIDLWGRIRRSDEAARALILANEEARRGVMLSLVSDVAQAYFELLEIELRLDIAKRTAASFSESLNLFRRRFEGGLASALESSRAEASLASAAADVPDLERAIAAKENQISVLIGQNPGPIARSGKLIQQAQPTEIPAGLPSYLLERRPDIRQAEQELVAANARIGVAKAQFFPALSLTTFFGRVSPELSLLTAGKANAWSLAAALTGPIFEGGRLVGQYDEAKARWDEARLRYEQSVLKALQEVSDALIAREKLAEVRVQQERAVRASSEAVRAATLRYTSGMSSYFEVLDSQRQLFPAENALAQTQLNQLLAVVQLYRALGGGWNLTSEKWLAP